MRKLKLLFAACALLLGAGQTWAQGWTDKTSVINNPSFEADDAIQDLKSCGWATDRATGWTIAPDSPGNSQVGIGNSSSTIQGIVPSTIESSLPKAVEETLPGIQESIENSKIFCCGNKYIGGLKPPICLIYDIDRQRV